MVFKTVAKPSEAAQEEVGAEERLELCREAEFEPLVRLEEFSADIMGEEHCLIELCKFYSFDEDRWNRFGLGMIKLQENKKNKRIRLLMREEKTLKICANHLGAQEFKREFEKAMEVNAELLGLSYLSTLEEPLETSSDEDTEIGKTDNQ